MVFTSLGQRIFVRFRKPVWAPTAPSKLFRIPEHTFYSEEERNQIIHLHKAFQAQETSIIEYMKHEFYIPSTKSGGVPDEFLAKEREVDKVILEENDRENARIAKQKAEYFEALMRDTKAKVMEHKLKTEEMIMETNLKVDEFIKHNKDNPDVFVTPNNFEKKIDEAMENPVNFEFCIDRQGRKIGLKSLRDTPGEEQ